MKNEPQSKTQLQDVSNFVMAGQKIHSCAEVDDGVFNEYQLSDQEFDDEIASIDSQTNVMDHNASNDIIDSQLNSKDNDDDD